MGYWSEEIQTETFPYSEETRTPPPEFYGDGVENETHLLLVRGIPLSQLFGSQTTQTNLVSPIGVPNSGPITY